MSRAGAAGRGMFRAGAAGAATGRVLGVPVIRTGLAWRRTTLSLAVVALLVGRQAVLSDSLSEEATGVAVLVTLLGWLLLARVIQRRVVRMTSTNSSLSGLPLLLSAMATVGYAALGAILVIL